jgi:hypothetical protein
MSGHERQELFADGLVEAIITAQLVDATTGFHVWAERYDRAIDDIFAFKAYHARHPGFGLGDLVIIHRQLGQPEVARQYAKQLLSIRKDFTTGSWTKTQLRADTTGVESDIEALCAAGLPTN